MPTRTTTIVAALAAMAITTTGVVSPVGAADQAGDADIVAARQTASSPSSLTTAERHGTSRPTPSIQPEAGLDARYTTTDISSKTPISQLDGIGESDHHSAENTANHRVVGTIRAVIPDDFAQNDPPGILTTTVRVYGTDWLQTDSGATADLVHSSKLTCTGASVSGITVGSGGVSVSGGTTSKTATVEFSAQSWFHQFDYYDGAEWQCSVSNFAPGVTTRRAGGLVDAGGVGTRTEASYSFTW